ncbi:hypothetical protein Tsubulata_022936 [Turnera subulata]|uniref:Uncharacterized protein n=1 Tax=Turnera subulata TaxID=218843 RepID=A0A9Q0JCA3_9ROSI|nr:hypothetical protein Tsubulata_022936 [Turnera subulata]
MEISYGYINPCFPSSKPFIVQQYRSLYVILTRSGIGGYETEPDTWPSPAGGVQNVLEQFRQMPEKEQAKKLMKQYCKDNREKEVTHAMFQILAGDQS